jgi:hypothetical protein
MANAVFAGLSRPGHTHGKARAGKAVENSTNSSMIMPKIGVKTGNTQEAGYYPSPRQLIGKTTLSP